MKPSRMLPGKHIHRNDGDPSACVYCSKPEEDQKTAMEDCTGTLDTPEAKKARNLFYGTLHGIDWEGERK